MTSRLALCVTLIILTAFSAYGDEKKAAVLKGVVIEDEIDGPGMDNIPVSVDEAAANSTVSKDGGHFAFTFPDKRVGEIVHVRVNRVGYVVVNDVQLEVTLPINPDAKPLIVILCPQDEREKWAGLLFRVTIDRAIEERYQQKLKTLEDKYQTDAAALAAEKAGLQKELDQAKAIAEKTAEQLAKNQSGQITELYQQAKRLFLEGKIEEAIMLLGDNDEKRRESVTQAKQTIEQQKKVIDNAVQEWLLKAQLLTVQLRFADAQATYQQAIDAAPDSFDANFDFAYFSQSLNRFDVARAAYSHGLEWARKNAKNAELARTLNNLGVLDHDQNRMEEARKEYAEALQIRRELAQKNPEAYLEIAETLNNLGILDHDQNRIEESRKEYAEVLQICRELAQKNPETYLPEIADTLNNLGVLDHNQNRMEEARKEYAEALQIRRALAQKNPEAYLPQIAETLNNLGVLDSDQNRMEEARKEYAETLRIRRALARKNPETYLPEIADTLNNLGVLDHNQNRMEEARKEYAEALQIRRTLAQKNLEAYLPQIAEALNNLGVLDSDQNRMEEARKEYAETLQIRRELAQKKPRS